MASPSSTANNPRNTPQQCKKMSKKEIHTQRQRRLYLWRKAGGQVVEDEARIANLRIKMQAGMKGKDKQKRKANISMKRMVRAGIYTGWDDTTPNVALIQKARKGLPHRPL
ncbi:unnamed protein product [Ectocarpus sp. 4 AP-2014]